MRLVGPFQYTVTAREGGHAVLNDKGRNTFVAPVTNRYPKIYIFAADGSPIYVGQTVQGMPARMRLGFLSDGSSGYYGYRWRHVLQSAQLLVWCLEDVEEQDELLALECIESEIFFAYRLKYDQWPAHQTEIHFHQTTAEHRRLAAEVFGHFTTIAPDQALQQTAAAVSVPGSS
jgi:hypothetical protein